MQVQKKPFVGVDGTAMLFLGNRFVIRPRARIDIPKIVIGW